MTDNEQIRTVLNEHPDLPVMLLTPSTDSLNGYDCYYHEGIDATIEHILMPRKVEKAIGSYWGLNDEKYYTDHDDVAEDVATWLFEMWDDVARKHGYSPSFGAIPNDSLTEFCGYEYDHANDVSLGTMSDRLADRIVEDMPWQDYVVIRASL